MNAKYCVVLTEYERGWGSDEVCRKYFDTFQEAKNYRDKENSVNTEKHAPDYYIQAGNPFLVDLDLVK